MQRFIRYTLKPVLIVGGALTALAGAGAVSPRFAVEMVLKLRFVPDYTIVVQHWGIMVLLLGGLMVAAAFKETWRAPILLYSMIEKALFVAFYVANRSESYAYGFVMPAIMDGTLAVWIALYFASLRSRSERA